MITDVLRLASFNLYPVRLHFPIFEGDTVTCSCGKPKCSSQGKHPVGVEWGKSATQDPEVIEEQFSNAPWNVGIILGICHGIPADQAVIDIEDDTLEGRAMADTILQDYPAPTYTSGKSLHRLYRWSPDLPPVANLTINGLEFRFGGKGKETQSVAPPSRHANGKHYQWLEGKSLDDLPITPLPQHLVEYLCEEYARQASTGSSGPSTSDARKFRSPRGKITHPGRHDALLKESNRLWRLAYQLWGINAWEEQDAVDQVWIWLAGNNALVCEPPKSEDELQVIFRSSKAFMFKEIIAEIEAKEAEAKEAAEPEQTEDDTFGNWLFQHGIRMQPDKRLAWDEDSPDRIDEWQCNWKMQYLTEGDEELIAVHAEGAEKPSIMTHDEFAKASLFAWRMAQDTKGKFCLARTFTQWTWQSIWEGKTLGDKKKPKGIVRGLREYLQNKAEVVEHAQQDLADQVEDIILGMAGNLAVIRQQLEIWLASGQTYQEGRLNLTPTGQLSTIKPPEEPTSGWYWSEGKIVLLVKNDELNRYYRKSYGSGVANRLISEVMTGQKLRFERKKFNSGPMAGRWYLRETENSTE